ncbi:MAG: hypothetical protein C4519_28290 [Desulfobacteraceae bacterium]|nr:MAG: hypothetical protein C4519_28290 [Desulfobacteraceae bacterium]
MIVLLCWVFAPLVRAAGAPQLFVFHGILSSKAIQVAGGCRNNMMGRACAMAKACGTFGTGAGETMLNFLSALRRKGLKARMNKTGAFEVARPGHFIMD